VAPCVSVGGHVQHNIVARAVIVSFEGCTASAEASGVLANSVGYIQNRCRTCSLWPCLQGVHGWVDMSNNVNVARMYFTLVYKSSCRCTYLSRGVESYLAYSELSIATEMCVQTHALHIPQRTMCYRRIERSLPGSLWIMLFQTLSAGWRMTNHTQCSPAVTMAKLHVRVVLALRGLAENTRSTGYIGGQARHRRART